MSNKMSQLYKMCGNGYYRILITNNKSLLRRPITLLTFGPI